MNTNKTNTDKMNTVAEQICELWTACGGYGPPHEFKVLSWGRGTTRIQQEYGLSSQQWCEAHQLAVRLGARRGIGTV